ncbi:MAG: FxLYD domain-containing protein [Terriglobales bacterium]
MAQRLDSKPFVIGVVVTIAVVLAIWFAERQSVEPAGRLDNGYAASVIITGARVSQGESLMAGGVVYYDGTLENNGSKTLTGYTVNLTFHDVDGAPLETDKRVLLDNRQQPLSPHANRTFEIGFDRTPSGWNQAPPDVLAVAVYTR